VNKLPLFGQDSSPQHTSSILSIIITCILWAIMSITGFFIEFDNSKPKYETVQIVLDSPKQVLEESEKMEAEEASDSEEELAEAVTEPVSAIENETDLFEESPLEEAPVEKLIEEPLEAVAKESPIIENKTPELKPENPEVEKKLEPVKTQKPVESKAEETAKPVENKPVESKKVETKPVEAVKAVESKPVEPPAAKEPEKVQYELQKTAEELWEEQMAKKKQSKEVDWDALFADDANSSDSSSTSSTNKVTTTSSTTGSAVKTTNSDNKGQKTENKNQSNQQKKASDTTSEALKDVLGANSSSKNTKSEISAKTSMDGSGKLMMEMADGSKRALLIPSKPAIVLSEKAAQMISLPTINVRITFKVVEKGNIPRSEIKIENEAILPELVRSEIIEQLSKWVFEEAETDATASFLYTIEKR